MAVYAHQGVIVLAVDAEFADHGAGFVFGECRIVDCATAAVKNAPARRQNRHALDAVGLRALVPDQNRKPALYSRSVRIRTIEQRPNFDPKVGPSVRPLEGYVREVAESAALGCFRVTSMRYTR